MIKAGEHYLSFLLLLFLSSALSAQDDYAITTKGDTMRGKLKYPLIGLPRLQTADRKITMRPDSISMYHYTATDETWCSYILPRQSNPQFIRRMVNGAIRLYTYSVYQGQNLNVAYWYAEKDNTPIGEIIVMALGGKGDERKNFFRSLIADNAVLVKRFDDEKKYTLSYLKKLVVEYNKQAGEPSQ